MTLFRTTLPTQVSVVVLLGCAVLLSGCRATFVQPAASPSTAQSRWTHFFFLGAVGHAEIDARELCASGRVRSVETHGSVVTTLLSIVTVGIYTPREVEVTCDGG